MNNLNKLKEHLTSSEGDALERLIVELSEKWPDAKLKLFGSKARGDSDDWKGQKSFSRK